MTKVKLEGKALDRLRDLIKEAKEKGASPSESDNLMDDLEKFFDEKVAAALAPLQEKYTANLQRLNMGNVPTSERGLGTTAARALRAFILTEGDKKEAASFAKTKWGDDEPAIKALIAAQKTMTEGSSTGGGLLISGDPAGELIELLRAESVIRGLNPIVLTMNSDSKPVPRTAGGASSGYIGENTADQASDMAFEGLMLRIKKLRATVAISNELNDDADGSTDQMVIGDITSSMANTEDVGFIRSPGTENSPKGLRYWAPAGNVVASVAANDATNPTLAEVEEDLSAMIALLSDANVRMIRPAWIMSNRTHNFLNWNVKDGNGLRVYKDELASGKLNGWAVGKTNNIPNNLGVGTRGESELYLVDMADVIIGDRKQVEFKVSDSATFVDSLGNSVSAFDNDLLVIRAISRHDLVVRHPESIAVRTNLVYTTS